MRNDSQDWARAVLDVAVAYDANLDTVYRVLEEAGQGLRQEPAFADLLLEDPAVWGVQSLDADGVIVRIAVKTTPLQQWAVTRELRRRVKDALDEAGIDIPFPQRAPQVMPSTGGHSHAGPGGQRPSCRTAENITGGGGV